MYSNRSGSIGIYHIRIHPNPSESIKIDHISIHQYPSEFIRINQSIIRIWRHTSSQPVRIYSNRSGSIGNLSESIRIHQNVSESISIRIQMPPKSTVRRGKSMYQNPSVSIRIHQNPLHTDGFWWILTDSDRSRSIWIYSDRLWWSLFRFGFWTDKSSEF